MCRRRVLGRAWAAAALLASMAASRLAGEAGATPDLSGVPKLRPADTGLEPQSGAPHGHRAALQTGHPYRMADQHATARRGRLKEMQHRPRHSLRRR